VAYVWIINIIRYVDRPNTRVLRTLPPWWKKLASVLEIEWFTSKTVVEEVWQLFAGDSVPHFETKWSQHYTSICLQEVGINIFSVRPAVLPTEIRNGHLPNTKYRALQV